MRISKQHLSSLTQSKYHYIISKFLYFSGEPSKHMFWAILWFYFPQGSTWHNIPILLLFSIRAIRILCSRTFKLMIQHYYIVDKSKIVFRLRVKRTFTVLSSIIRHLVPSGIKYYTSKYGCVRLPNCSGCAALLLQQLSRNCTLLL